MKFVATILHTSKEQNKTGCPICTWASPHHKISFSATFQEQAAMYLHGYPMILTTVDKKSHCCIADVLLDRSVLDSLAHQAVSEELADLLPDSSKSSGK